LEVKNVKRIWNAESSNKQLDETPFEVALRDIQTDPVPANQIGGADEVTPDEERPGSIAKSDFSFKDT
jgi:hypothetical protein